MIYVCHFNVYSIVIAEFIIKFNKTKVDSCVTTQLFYFIIQPSSLRDKRVVAARLERHMSARVPGWHESQYGFRRSSTIDAVRRLRALTDDMVSGIGRKRVQLHTIA